MRSCVLAVSVGCVVGCGSPNAWEVERQASEEATYVAASLTVPGRARVFNTTSGLNLRSGAGASHAVLAVMPVGTVVDVTAGPTSGYYQVIYLGTTGWAYGSYLETVAAPPPPPPTGIWKPRPGTSWQWQLKGTVDTSFNVKMYDIDLFDTPQSVIDTLHAASRVVICYFSGGSFEDWRRDAASFPAAVKGKNLDGWPGERWLDVRSSTVRDIMRTRLDLARSKKCDGVEPDNVDGYTNDSGFPLTSANQLDFNRFLAREAHARGLSIGLKNDLDQIPALVGDFDWALNEQCFEFDECDTQKPFIDAGKAVFNAEYSGAASASRICPKANARNLDTLIKPLELTASRVACR